MSLTELRHGGLGFFEVPFNNTDNRYEGFQQITAFLNSQINQLQALRALKSYERSLGNP